MGGFSHARAENSQHRRGYEYFYIFKDSLPSTTCLLSCQISRDVCLCRRGESRIKGRS
jgi:hypothetical protein